MEYIADNEVIQIWLDNFQLEHPDLDNKTIKKEIEETEDAISNEILWRDGSCEEAREGHEQNLANLREWENALRDMLKYDVVLLEKEGENGLNAGEVEQMFRKLNGKEAYPVEYFGVVESSAMGFITKEAANKIDFETDNKSAIGRFIGGILDDLNLESGMNEYKFNGLDIFLSRNI